MAGVFDIEIENQNVVRPEGNSFEEMDEDNMYSNVADVCLHDITFVFNLLCLGNDFGSSS